MVEDPSRESCWFREEYKTPCLVCASSDSTLTQDKSQRSVDSDQNDRLRDLEERLEKDVTQDILRDVTKDIHKDIVETLSTVVDANEAEMKE